MNFIRNTRNQTVQCTHEGQNFQKIVLKEDRQLEPEVAEAYKISTTLKNPEELVFGSSFSSIIKCQHKCKKNNSTVKKSIVPTSPFTQNKPGQYD